MTDQTRPLTNVERAESGEHTLQRYALDQSDSRGVDEPMTGDNDSTVRVMVRMLADLAHFARMSGLDFKAVCNNAQVMHEKEARAPDLLANMDFRGPCSDYTNPIPETHS